MSLFNALTQLGISQGHDCRLESYWRDETTYLVRHAYCTSPKCSGHLAKKIEKNVHHDKATCPDCGYVLVWETKRKKAAEHTYGKTSRGRISRQ